MWENKGVNKGIAKIEIGETLKDKNRGLILMGHRCEYKYKSSNVLPMVLKVY